MASPLKFQRNYQLIADTLSDAQVKALTGKSGQSSLQVIGENQEEIKLPFTLEFDCLRNILASANTGTFKIYNLNEQTRTRLQKDEWTFNISRGVKLSAGYGEEVANLPSIFNGTIKKCSSTRSGVNFITTIEAFDGAYALVNGRTNTSFPKGAKPDDIIRELTKDMPGSTFGVASTIKGELPRGNTFMGSTADLIKGVAGPGLDFFIDLGRVYVLSPEDCIQGSTQVITADSGLLNTPVREETRVTFDMIFEPGLLIGQMVELQSFTNRSVNGVYKILSLHHRGTISSAISGSATTTVSMWGGPGVTLKVIN